MRILINLVVVIIFLIAVSATLWAGKYFMAVLLLIPISLYWFLEWPSRKKAYLSAIQYGVTRTLYGILLCGIGLFSIWKGIVEFSTPVSFFYAILDFVAGLIREHFGAIGSMGISILLWWFGGLIFFTGVRLLSFGTLNTEKHDSLESNHKPSSALELIVPIKKSLSYLIFAAFLIYFIHGAISDSLVLPRGGGRMPITVYGWGAWLACLFPLSFVAESFFRIDPMGVFSGNERILFRVLAILIGIGSLAGAFIYGSKL